VVLSGYRSFEKNWGRAGQLATRIIGPSIVGPVSDLKVPAVRLPVADCRHHARRLTGLEDDDDLIRLGVAEVGLPDADGDLCVGAVGTAA
jgi:hypothetical protein